jgi:ketosteroid isomerase-like protein
MTHAPAGLSFLVFLALLAGPAHAQTSAELDEYWADIARSVEAGDFQAYSALYHADAVLVDLGSGTSTSIARALAGWEPGFRDTREGRAEASVSFRFTQRLHDADTAHETGIFRYSLTPRGEAETVAIVHFEALLVKKSGVWLTVMEYQKEPATAEEWEASRRGGR